VGELNRCFAHGSARSAGQRLDQSPPRWSCISTISRPTIYDVLSADGNFDAKGKTHPIDQGLAYPNGIALTPDGKKGKGGLFRLDLGVRGFKILP